MFRRIVTSLTLVGFVLLQGCTTIRYIPWEEYQESAELKDLPIVAFVTADSTEYYFAENAEVAMDSDFISGQLDDGDSLRMPISQIQGLDIKEVSDSRTIVLLMGGLTVVVITAVIIALTHHKTELSHPNAAN